MTAPPAGRRRQETSRRDFLHLVGRAGGSAGVYHAMSGLGLMGGAGPAYGGPPQLTGDAGRGRRVAILGAGIAGLTAAYELGRAGYECVVLEASDRLGGRNWTVRRGDTLTEIGGERQTCDFDPGLALNVGPGRISHHHRALLEYCRAFGVPLQIYNNINRAAFYYSAAPGPLADQRLPNRVATFDMQGWIGELLAKAINQHALDDALTADDAERLLDYLRYYGALSDDLRYSGSPERGWDVPPALGPGVPSTPYDLSALLRTGFWRRLLDGTPDHYDEQMTMLEPVGGMDQIVVAFAQRLAPLIRTGAEVRQIRQTAAGVRIVYRDQTTRTEREIKADFCICTIPLPVLRHIPADLSAEMRAAIAAVPYQAATRVGLQTARRFWEEDDAIYGGITFTDLPISQIWYPNSGFHTAKGVLIAAYNRGDDAWAFGRLPPAARIAATVEQGQRIHPQYATEIEAGFTIAWQNTPYALGAWATFTPQARATSYATLLRPDGRVYLAGDYLSYFIGWQEGAVRSAQAVCEAIHARVGQG